MSQGDRVIVVDPASPLWGHVGVVTGLTPDGHLCVEMEGAALNAMFDVPAGHGFSLEPVTVELPPHALDLAALFGK